MGDLVADVTIRGLDVAHDSEPLEHIISAWERRKGLFAFDDVEFAYFPSQAMLMLRMDDAVSTALVLPAERVVLPDVDAFRRAISLSSSARFERVASTDEFRVELQRSPPVEPDAGAHEHDLLLTVISVFSDGQPHDAEEVVRRVRMSNPGDIATLTRAVAAVLATDGCFETSDGWNFLYRPDQPHAPRSAGRLTTVGALAVKSARARMLAVQEDRRLRRFRAEGMRSPHMVRGHLRRLNRS